MNTLDWAINELLDPIKNYIKENKEYFDFNKQFSQSTDNLAQDTGSGVTAAVATESTASTIENPEPAMGMLTAFTYSVVNKFSNRVMVKAEKVSEANAFVAAVEKIRDRQGPHDRDTVRQRILDLKFVLENEVEKLKTLLLTHKQASGKYEALLRVFVDTLNWMTQEKILEILCTTLRFETLDKQIKSGGNATFLPPIPLTKELVTYLSRQIICLHLDEARCREKEMLDKYARMLPETAAENISRMCIFNIDAINLFNTKIEANAGRLDLTLVAINGLRQKTRDIYDDMHGYILSTKNPFLDEMLNELKRLSITVESKINNREANALMRRMGSASPTPSSNLG